VPRIVWTVDEDGVRRRWCNGPCGRRLDATHFRSTGRTNLNVTCNQCHRVYERERYRRKYRNHHDASFRQRERARKRLPVTA
jgi:hypothetical protein